MGLLSSIFGSKSKQKTTIPDFLKGPLTGFAGDVGSYLNSDPHQYVAPASSLQNLAFSQAQNLGSEMAPLNDALAAVKAAGAAPAASAGLAAQTGPAAQSSVSTYRAPTLGNASQAGAVNIAPTQTINGQSLLDNLQGYMDPATEALVNTTMADYQREAAQQRAQQQAKLAGMGSFGSGGNFYLSNFDIANLLKGANLENQLRSQAYTQAVQASNLDAARRQDASAFNAGAANTRAGQQAGFDLSNNQFNAGAKNQYGLAQADLNANAGQFNANAANQSSMFNAGQANQLGMFNTGQTNDMSQFNAGLQNDQLTRALQAAGMQGDIANSLGSNQRADIGVTGTLGAMQHDIDQAYASALPNQLLQAGEMFNPLMGLTGKTQTNTSSPFNIFGAVSSLFGK